VETKPQTDILSKKKQNFKQISSKERVNRNRFFRRKKRKKRFFLQSKKSALHFFAPHFFAPHFLQSKKKLSGQKRSISNYTFKEEGHWEKNLLFH
jgi:hypothetical protein